MPTPIEHLSVAQEILTSPVLPQAVRASLENDGAVRGAFFLGHIAPDVQVVSRQPREATHFFTLPLTRRRPAYTRMLATHPELAYPSKRSAAHTAFIAGYVAHLLLDELWVREIFGPTFGLEQTWGDWRERRLLHNVLRAWLDQRARPRLPAGVGQLLRRARPDRWLPFAADDDLCRWRDLVADQLEPGATIRTEEILARRARVPGDEFVAQLAPDVMAEQIFSRVSPARLDAFYAQAVEQSRDLVIQRLNGCVEDEFE